MNNYDAGRIADILTRIEKLESGIQTTPDGFKWRFDPQNAIDRICGLENHIHNLLAPKIVDKSSSVVMTMPSYYGLIEDVQKKEKLIEEKNMRIDQLEKAISSYHQKIDNQAYVLSLKDKEIERLKQLCMRFNK
jgi:hypothetical protein